MGKESQNLCSIPSTMGGKKKASMVTEVCDLGAGEEAGGSLGLSGSLWLAAGPTWEEIGQ